jgi:hypothetical protein
MRQYPAALLTVERRAGSGTGCDLETGEVNDAGEVRQALALLN